jgi:hypothetical protein
MTITGITVQQAQGCCDCLHAIGNTDDNPGLRFRLATPEEIKAIQLLSMLPGKAMSTGVNDKNCVRLNHRHDAWCEVNVKPKQAYG